MQLTSGLLDTLLHTKEIRFFENERIRVVQLQPVYDYLGTIAPSSMESERAFSAPNQICTKIRSSITITLLIAYCSKQLTLLGQAVWKLKHS